MAEQQYGAAPSASSDKAAECEPAGGGANGVKPGVVFTLSDSAPSSPGFSPSQPSSAPPFGAHKFFSNSSLRDLWPSSAERRRHASTVSAAAVVQSRSIPYVTTEPALGHRATSQRSSRKVRRYYRQQSDLLDGFRADLKTLEHFEVVQPSLVDLQREKDASDDEADGGDDELDEAVEAILKRSVADADDGPLSARHLAAVTLGVNLLLLVAKSLAVALSGSLSIVSSLVDSSVDIVSGLVIWLTARAIRRRDPYLYPRGRTRLEPLAVTIISVVMGVASFQVMAQSTSAIISHSIHPDVGWATLGIMAATIVLKLGLFVACHRRRDVPSVRVLAQDHRNDCVSNAVAILGAYLGTRYWKYLDPIGAIVVSVYVAASWFATGYSHMVMLSGRTAEPRFINRVIKICTEHDPRITAIDTVYVYHFGTKFLVEVHVVLDAEMTLRDAHDISEPLQCKLEHLEYVERAFVHNDYEVEHRPEDEHKVV